ncbi:MAG: signal recognition particle protein Srp54 [Nanobdellota archaeon]
MVLDKLSSSLQNTLKKIASSVFVDERLINELAKEIQRSLLQADVNVKLVLDLTRRIKERALKEELPSGLSKKEQLINIVYEELVKFLGSEKADLNLATKPAKVMLVGLFGSGKTTTTGKLARYYKKRGMKVAAVGLDVHRPAAMDQLRQIAEQLEIPYYIDKEEKDPKKIWAQVKQDKYDLLIIDTAGRDALSDDLITEIESLNETIQPQEKVLVISADIGQAAQRQAEQFHSSVGITGVITTKMDGTAKAGGALTACAITQAPIKFIGVGEKPDDLEPFNPKGFVSRLLGMGDLEALLEKARGAIDEDEAKDLGKRFLKGDFSLIDLYEQMQAMKKMGPLKKVVEMIPGFSQANVPQDMLEGQDEKLEVWRHIMDSCTQEELENPEILDMSRVERISRGSGTKPSDVRELVKQYKSGKKMMKMMKGKDPQKMMKKMGNFKF